MSQRYLPSLLAGLLGVILLTPAVWAVGGPGDGGRDRCTPNCSTPPSQPSCTQPTVSWADGCGGTCVKSFNNTCVVTTPATCSAPGVGTKLCGQDCSPPQLSNVCSAAQPACGGLTTEGTWSCTGESCTAGPSGPCPPLANWVPYSFVQPGDPVYSYPSVKDRYGAPYYGDPTKQNLLGLAAKGNIVVGDYTSDAFKTKVLPYMNGKTGSKTQPYAVDKTDVALGYQTGAGGYEVDENGLPLFDGNYDQQDKDGLLPGLKSDNTPRKFYESTLSDDFFKLLLKMSATGITIDGVLFTNHAIAGYVSNAGGSMINGSYVARDDVLTFGGGGGNILTINHDQRLIDPKLSNISLPYSTQRPVLTAWKECLPDKCP